MRGVGWRCSQKPSIVGIALPFQGGASLIEARWGLSAGKRPFSRASFQSEGTAERRGLQRHAIRRSAAARSRGFNFPQTIVFV